MTIVRAVAAAFSAASVVLHTRAGFVAISLAAAVAVAAGRRPAAWVLLAVLLAAVAGIRIDAAQPFR